MTNFSLFILLNWFSSSNLVVQFLRWNLTSLLFLLFNVCFLQFLFRLVELCTACSDCLSDCKAFIGLETVSMCGHHHILFRLHAFLARLIIKERLLHVAHVDLLRPHLRIQSAHRASLRRLQARPNLAIAHFIVCTSVNRLCLVSVSSSISTERLQGLQSQLGTLLLRDTEAGLLGPW